MLLSFSYQVVSNSFATWWTVACPGSSVHGISQARILERVAISFSRGFPDQGSNPYPLHWQDSLPQSNQGSPNEQDNLKKTEAVEGLGGQAGPGREPTLHLKKCSKRTYTWELTFWENQSGGRPGSAKGLIALLTDTLQNEKSITH